MKPLYNRHNLEYPLYVYDGRPPKPVKNGAEIHVNIHIYYGYYDACSCNICPIEKECTNRLHLYHLFPEHLEEYPEDGI